MRRFRLLVVAAIVGLFFPTPALFAAITGSVSGTVTDPTGALIPGVQMNAVNEASGVSFETVTDSKGFYSFNALDVGLYTVTATTTGFAKFQDNHIKVDADSSIRTDISL